MYVNSCYFSRCCVQCVCCFIAGLTVYKNKIYSSSAPRWISDYWIANLPYVKRSNEATMRMINMLVNILIIVSLKLWADLGYRGTLQQPEKWGPPPPTHLPLAIVQDVLTPQIWCMDYTLIQNKSGLTSEQHDEIASWLTSAYVSQPGKY